MESRSFLLWLTWLGKLLFFLGILNPTKIPPKLKKQQTKTHKTSKHLLKKGRGGREKFCWCVRSLKGAGWRQVTFSYRLWWLDLRPVGPFFSGPWMSIKLWQVMREGKQHVTGTTLWYWGKDKGRPGWCRGAFFLRTLSNPQNHRIWNPFESSKSLG